MGSEHLGVSGGFGAKSPRRWGAFPRYGVLTSSQSGVPLSEIKECEIHSRAKDSGSATATWFAELLSPNPWFKDVVPNVSRAFGTRSRDDDRTQLFLSTVSDASQGSSSPGD